MKRLAGLLLLCAFVTACTAPTPPPTATPSPTPPPTPTPTLPPYGPDAPLPNCALPPWLVPTLPAEIPAHTELDPSTNLHITGEYRQVDPATYHLAVSGKVVRPLSLTLDQLRCLARRETHAALICPGYFEDYATWGGVPLIVILALAGVQADAASLDLVGADGYSAFVTLDEARNPDNLIAYEWEGEPLPLLHGFPVRAVFPALFGNKWVKWLLEIQVK